MVVLGIDPGLAITGIGIIKEENNSQTLLFSKGIITPASSPLSSRLVSLSEELKKILDEFRPDVAVLEKLFFSSNAKTALVVGQARGVAQLTVAQTGIEITEYTPLEVKLSVTGYGHADKSQIQMMVKQILKLPSILKPDDVADAAAIALTHCFNFRLKKNFDAKMLV